MLTRQNITQAINTLETFKQSLAEGAIETSLSALTHQLTHVEHQAISAGSMAAERRQVTVMFADISGFTVMSEELDPEDVRNTINACFKRLDEAIDRYNRNEHCAFMRGELAIRQKSLA